ncbi:uncharacterized protein LOC115151379 [Salmo trutta]|uniref:uncharacterized protein LOC115151379 n=1 Tax=Salmo trutta TaxID=8032 RepID=UPI00113297E6|nr:uncharacterized protein LOC115151379 [Salmo trutta]
MGWHLVGQQASYQCNGRKHTNLPCYTLFWIFCFSYYQLMAPPAAPRREPPKWRERLLVPPEPSLPNKKSEYQQHLMAEYVSSMMQLTLGPTLNGYDWGPVQCPQAARLPPHHVPSFLHPTVATSQLPRDSRDRERLPSHPQRLPGLADLAAGDRTIGTLSPVQWRGPHSYTAPASMQLRSNRTCQSVPARMKPKKKKRKVTVQTKINRSVKHQHKKTASGTSPMNVS